MAVPENFKLFKSGVLPPAPGNLPAKFFYDFKQELKIAGWTIESSGDGLGAYGASSDVITVRGLGANGVNNLAWIRMQNPDGREICIQCVQGFDNSGSIGCRSKYSAVDGFVGGSPSATRVPSATDEGLFAGDGTDAAPTASAGGFVWGDKGNSSFAAIRTLYIGFFESVSPYRFLYAMIQDAYAGCVGGWEFDVLDPPGIGAADHVDTDPSVLYQAGRINSTGAAWGIRALDDMHRINAAYNPLGAGAMANVGGSFLPIACVPFGGNNLLFNQDSGDDFGGQACGPGMWSRYPDSIATANGIKGLSTLFAYNSYPDDSIGWGPFKLFSVNGVPREMFKLNGAIIPWDGTDPFNGTGWTTAVGGGPVKFWNIPEQFGGAVLDAIAPTLSNFVPAVGVAVELNDPITFDVTDETSLALVAILVSFADGSVFVAHDGDSFREPFLGAPNLRTNITDGFRFTLIKDGGWVNGSGDAAAPTFEYLVLDGGGNIGVVT